MSNGQVSECQTHYDTSQIIQKCVKIAQPDQLIDGDASPFELAHKSNIEEAALPGNEVSISQSAARVQSNENNLASKVAADSIQPRKPRPYSRTSCPSPYYFGGGFPSHDYLTSNKSFYYSGREDAQTPGTESFTSKSSTIITWFGKVESLRKSCFILKKNEENVPSSQSKPQKKAQTKSKFSKSFSGVHIRVGRFLWLPVRKRFGQVKSEKGDNEEISDPFEQFCRKVRAQNLSSYSERPSVVAIGSSADVPQTGEQSKISKEEKMEVRYLWAEKWRPYRLADFICNTQQARDLQLLVSQKRCPHMIFEGPTGAGKISLVRAMIREIYQNNEPIKQRKLTIHTKGEMMTEIVVPVIATSKHTEINVSSLNGFERNVIDVLVREERKLNSSECLDDYKVIVVCEADKLSIDTQNYICWLMERHQESCKLIFCCSNVSKLEPISSFCEVINVQLATNEQIIKVLMHIANKEGIYLPRNFAKRIADASEENLRQAIRSLEACKRTQYPFTEDQKISTGWEDVIAKIAKSMVDEQSPKQLYNIRAKLQRLMIHNLCPNLVFSTLVEELKQHLDDNLQEKLGDLYAAYNENMNNEVENPLTGNQMQSFVVDAKRAANQYIQIEEFTARFMSVYKAADNKKRHNTANQMIT